jgi:hypothetical protein
MHPTVSAHLRSDMPDNRHTSTALCTLHRYQRLGGRQLGTLEQLFPHPPFLLHT